MVPPYSSPRDYPTRHQQLAAFRRLHASIHPCRCLTNATALDQLIAFTGRNPAMTSPNTIKRVIDVDGAVLHADTRWGRGAVHDQRELTAQEAAERLASFSLLAGRIEQCERVEADEAAD